MKYEILIPALLMIVAGAAIAIRFLRHPFIVPEGFAGLLYKHGKFQAQLPVGRQIRWGRGLSMDLHDLRKTSMAVTGQDPGGNDVSDVSDDPQDPENEDPNEDGNPDDPTVVDRTDPPGSDGTITLKFDSCSAGTIEYEIPSINRQGVIPIERVVDDNIVICEALGLE